MPLDPTTIAVGKCYVTLTGQVRKVQEIDGDRVKYVHRGKKATPGWETGQWRWAASQHSRQILIRRSPPIGAPRIIPANREGRPILCRKIRASCA